MEKVRNNEFIQDNYVLKKYHLNSSYFILSRKWYGSKGCSRHFQ